MPFQSQVVSPLSTSTWASPPTAIVLHATAGATARSSIDHLRSEGLSYHCIIARDGSDAASTAKSNGTDPIVYFCVPFANRAAHVGSNIPLPHSGGRIANRCAIGIALANRQTGESYTPGQLAVLSEIIDLVKRECPSVTVLTTHAVIQPWNRRDPVGIDGAALARHHRLEWFAPTEQVIASFKPGRLRRPAGVNPGHSRPASVNPGRQRRPESV